MTEQVEIDPKETIVGIYGTAEWVPMPALEDCIEACRAAIPLHMGTWLINAPQFHPVWSQYSLSVVNLNEAEGLPEANKESPEITHELVLMAISPDYPQTVETMTGHSATGDLPILLPINISQQVTCTDDESKALGWLACRGVVNGILNPETADAPTLIRSQWKNAIERTLKHMRGEDCNDHGNA